MLSAVQALEFFLASASQKRNDVSRCADMATIIQNFAAARTSRVLRNDKSQVEGAREYRNDESLA